MGQQILGSSQEIEINLTDPTGLTGLYKALVCLRNSSVNSELAVTTEETNCGVLSAVGNTSVTVDFDAVCEAAPSGTQISYEEVWTALNAKTKVGVRVQSPGATPGASYYHQFGAYVTSLSLSQETGAYISFSGTLTSDGAIDYIP